jgi:ABC-2 type transport system permease protein
VIAKKDAVIYYLKPPVVSFGIIFPLFFYLAFAAGRNVPAQNMVPGHHRHDVVHRRAQRAG